MGAFKVPWSQEALSDAFCVTLSSQTQVFIVLSQLESTYFRGLEGQYRFEIDFTVSNDDDDEIMQAGRRYATTRSNTVQLDLENGTYVVRPLILARKLDSSKAISNTILATSSNRLEKLVRVAKSYDLAHAQVADWRVINEEVANRVDTVTDINTIHFSQSHHSHEHRLKSTLSTEKVLGYSDWDAVVPLGLRVLVNQGQASVKLMRHQDEREDVGDEEPGSPDTMLQEDRQKQGQVRDHE